MEPVWCVAKWVRYICTVYTFVDSNATTAAARTFQSIAERVVDAVLIKPPPPLSTVLQSESKPTLKWD